MRHTYFLIIFALALCTRAALGQEEATYTQYMANPAWVNMAYTGFDDRQNLFVNYRNNWAEFDGAPRNISANYHAAVSDRVGLGLLVGMEQVGELDDFRIGLAYAYRFGDKEGWKMSIGLNTEYESRSLNGSVLDNPNVDPNDPVIRAAIDGYQFFNVGAGFYGEYDEKFFVGLSLPKFFHNRIDETTFEEDGEAFQNFTLLGGYRFDLPQHGMKLEPSIFMKSLEETDFQIDANIRGFFLEDQLIGGLSYMNGDGDRLGFTIGTQLEAFRLFYSYDVSFQEFQDYANGSHEITLGFSWDRVIRSKE